MGTRPFGADFEGGADAPNIRPPRAAGGGAQDPSVSPAGPIPSLLGGHAQFAMGFVGVAVKSQGVDV